MTMDNFKGTKHLEVAFGQETRIAGCNGIGKSTIADAFFWVLLGSDSHGNAPGSNNFREKPLDEEGKEIHNLTTAVTLDCTLDGQPFQLRREQTENWVKKRGQAEAMFSGNVSSWWINGVERKANDFKAAVASITSTDVFCYIAMLSAFNQADVKTRRSVLVGMSDKDIAAHLLEEPDYSFIKAETTAKNIKPEDLQKMLKDRLKLQNAELKMIPARADEARRLIPDMQEVDAEKAQQTLDQATQATEELDRKIAVAMTADTGAVLLERIAVDFASGDYPDYVRPYKDALDRALAQQITMKNRIDYVDAWLCGLNTREAWVIRHNVIDNLPWRETVRLYQQEFGVYYSKDSLKRIKEHALEKIYRMAED